MSLNKCYQTCIAIALSFMLSNVASADELPFISFADLISTPTTDLCSSRNMNSELRFVIGDEPIYDDISLSPTHTFTVGDSVSIQLVEDLRVCVRDDYVDLWIALEMPDPNSGQILRFFMIKSPLPPFFAFVTEPAPFKKDIGHRTQTHDVLDFYIETDTATSGTYRFYAAYSKAGTDLSELLFTLRSNRASAKVMIDAY